MQAASSLSVATTSAPSRPQITNVESTYRLLADFFEAKRDEELTMAEVAICLEWLNQVTEPSIFVTPAPRKSTRIAGIVGNPKTTIGMSSRGLDPTPIKRQIRELLFKQEDEKASKLDSQKTEPVAFSEEQSQTEKIITKTAKTILQALESAPKVASFPNVDGDQISTATHANECTNSDNNSCSSNKHEDNNNKSNSNNNGTMSNMKPIHFNRQDESRTSVTSFERIDPNTLPHFSFELSLSPDNAKFRQQVETVSANQLPSFHFNL